MRGALTYGADQLLNLVRALRKDGSDFLVEEDLASIFGRGKIEPSLEKDFRDAVKTGSIQPLHAGSQISLDAGPGATVGRALKDRFYMSCVIQVSFLGWMHEETALAATLVDNMHTRYESKVQGATPNPDYNGILKTLQACSSQTSQYRWENLVSLVENRLQKSIQHFQFNPAFLRFLRYLSPSLLLGLMDYLYMVQSLPEDRFIIVDSPQGLVSLVVWAHYILGLTVYVENSPDGDVGFGLIGSPQVIVKWTSALVPPLESITPNKPCPISSTISLLDADMQVLLRTEPNDDKATNIEGQEWCRLKGYGTTALRRWYNATTFVTDDDPIFVETANFAVSYATIVSRRTQRVKVLQEAHEARRRVEGLDNPRQCYSGIENWRLFDSSSLLFWGIKLDKRKINKHLENLGGKRVEDLAISTDFRDYLLGTKYGLEMSRAANFKYIEELASWILAFARIINVESCADLPLRINRRNVFFNNMRYAGRLGSSFEDPDFWFKQITEMMNKYIWEGQSKYGLNDLFLMCHNGWSLFYSSVGDYDPGEIDWELLFIKRGVPTSTKTGERKYRIVDAPPFRPAVNFPTVSDKAYPYVPRCATKVYKRTEHYSSRSDEFWLSIRFDVENVEIPHRGPLRRTEQGKRYSFHGSYARFQKALWSVFRSTPCPHGNEDYDPLPLDLDAQGFGVAGESRICICLVKGDARTRWAVVYRSFYILSADIHAGSQLLLRCDGCCADCAVKAASAMKGKWLVVL